MYKGFDTDELQNNITDIKEAIDCLNSAKERIDGTIIDYKLSILHEIDDAINDLADELPDMQDAYTDACAEEEQAETREYWRDVI